MIRLSERKKFCYEKQATVANLIMPIQVNNLAIFISMRRFNGTYSPIEIEQ